MSKISKKTILITFPVFICANNLIAGGFQMHEQNGSLGDVHAGYSVDSHDASTNFYNPAGLTDILHSITTTSAITVSNEVTFKGQSEVRTLPVLGDPIIGSGSVTTNAMHVIPSLHYATPINENWAFGISIVSPFAGEIDWSSKDFTRYNTTLNGIKTINFSPSLAYKVNQVLSIGFGTDVQYVDMKINKMVGLNLDMLNGGTPSDSSINDSKVTNQLSATTLGWHFGLLYKPLSNLKLGLSYHSAINHKAKGTSSLKGILAGDETNPSHDKENKSTNLKATIKIPQSTAFSLQYNPLQNLDLVTTVIHTKWDVVKTFDLENVATAFVDDVTRKPVFLSLVSTNMNLKNTFGILTGVRWQYNNDLQLKSGFGYDQTPSRDNERGLNMPDGDRLLFGLGGNYRYTKGVNIEAGWMYVKVTKTIIRKTTTVPQPVEGTMNLGEVNLVDGIAKGHAHLIGIQTSIDTDKILSRFM